jgi:hypothetical protein
VSGRYARIFLLSHMRAFTSLAGHILGSHPRINGYFEMHMSYEDPAALDKQLDVFQRYESLKENSCYLFDKLLHNDHRFDPQRLGLADVKILVTLQQPERTIKSIVDLFSKKAGEELYASPLEATNYYVERVNALAAFCRSASQPYYYYDAELFQAAPEQLLSKLTEWLELDSPLGERYQIFSQTGKFGRGDSSGFIGSGKIEKTRADYAHIEVADDALNRALTVYRDCRSQIIANAADAVAL